jgi:hypothetical protein
MPATTTERYVVASCHVERPLDDRVWAAFAALQEGCPGRLAVAALIRPPDPAAGEAEDLWLERARRAAERGPLGHHVHWTSPSHARPSDGDEPAARVLRESAWLREHGLRPRFFCGGGWYTDAGVATACAELGYADCTPRATRPPYLADDAPWAQLAAPARLRVGGSAPLLLALPTTHSAGDALRAAIRPGLPAHVHVYFHDTDLVAPRRRRVVVAALRLLGRREGPSDLDALAAAAADAPELDWADVARGGASGAPE